MDLWIRSQDKKHLIRATNIDIAFNGKIFVNEVKFDNDLCVGNYLGEERALEVLDEIDEFKNDIQNQVWDTSEQPNKTSITFIMPKE